MKRRFTSAILVLLALAIAATTTFAEPAKPGIARRIAIGGEGGWDYLTMDSSAHRLFVTHGTRVVVVDVRTDSIVGEIAGTPGVHGVALAPDLRRGYTSNGRDSSVTVFDLKTLATLATVRIPGRNPDAIAYDATSARVFTFNGGSANATAIDAHTNSVVGNVALGGKPEFAVTDGGGRLFVNLEDSSAVVALDTRTLQVLHRWALAPGEEPTGLALDRAHHRLFSACGNGKLVVLDAEDGRVVAALPIGQGVDGAAFDATRELAFTSNGEGTMSVYHEESPDQFRALETVTTERGARTLTVDEADGSLYLATADFGPPPAPTAERPHPRPSLVSGTFRVLVVSSPDRR